MGRAIHGTPRCLPVLLVLGLALACGGSPRGSETVREAQAELARIREGRETLTTARRALERAHEGGDEAEFRRAQTAYEAAYSTDQKRLATFLNAALNQRPDAPETREGLGLFTESAVQNARILLDQAGDPRRAAEVLEAPARCYRVLGLPEPADLAATLAEARRLQAAPPTPTPTAPSKTGRRPRR